MTTVALTPEEHKFLLEALMEKFDRMMANFVNLEPQWKDVSNITKEQFEKELKNVSKAMEDAPFGLKKDGTAKAKPGRKRLVIKRNKKKAEVKSDV